MYLVSRNEKFIEVMESYEEIYNKYKGLSNIEIYDDEIDEIVYQTDTFGKEIIIFK